MQTITISLPENVYQRVKRQSLQNKRDVAEEVVSVVIGALPTAVPLTDLADERQQLHFLPDDDLWRAAEMAATPSENERMQFLVEKQQRVGLTSGEQEEVALLARFFTRIMMVRAEAAVLLQERGHDITILGSSTEGVLSRHDSKNFIHL